MVADWAADLVDMKADLLADCLAASMAEEMVGSWADLMAAD